jgi:uncharacterized membrane protein YfcA
MDYFIALVGALLAGGINTLSGNGSAITLTILMELLGLPADVANGTNRVGVLANGIGGSFAFHKAGRFTNQSEDKKREMWRIVIITCVGACLGIYLSLIISNAAYKSFFRYLLVVMLFVVLIKPKRWLIPQEDKPPLPLWVTVILFFILGIYGGFIQMGMGVFFMAVMVLAAHYEIIQASVVKVLVITVYTVLAVLIFAWQDLIDWRIGALMAVGQMIGGYLTARFATTHPKAGLYAYRLLIVVIIGAIAKMFWPF